MPSITSEKQRVDAAGRAFAGSRKQIQFYVNEDAASLNHAINQALGYKLTLEWVSPLESVHYQEHKDVSFLNVVGMTRFSQELKAFWPKGGPSWDALARVKATTEGVLLLEAKSHIPEMYAGGCKATPESLEKISASLAATKAWLGVNPALDWLGRSSYRLENRTRNGSLYQMANRIAHLYFFREVLGIEAWLVNLCFLDDPHSPTSQASWDSGLSEVKRNLGLTTVPFAVDVFLPGRVSEWPTHGS